MSLEAGWPCCGVSVPSGSPQSVSERICALLPQKWYRLLPLLLADGLLLDVLLEAAEQPFFILVPLYAGVKHVEGIFFFKLLLLSRSQIKPNGEINISVKTEQEELLC